MTVIEKYSRVGYVNLDRHVDKLLASFLNSLPTEDVGYLPVRWRYFDPESFIKRHGYLGTTLIARAANSHTIVCRGVKAVRFWTDSADRALVQISEAIAAKLKEYGFPVELIPDGVKRKASGFSYRVMITKEPEARAIAFVFRKMFDV